MEFNFLPDELRLAWANIIVRKPDAAYIYVENTIYPQNVMQHISCYSKNASSLFQLHSTDSIIKNISKLFLAPFLYTILIPGGISLTKAKITYNFILKHTDSTVLGFLCAAIIFIARIIISILIVSTGIFFLTMWIGKPLYLCFAKDHSDTLKHVGLNEAVAIDHIQNLMSYEFAVVEFMVRLVSFLIDCILNKIFSSRSSSSPKRFFPALKLF